MWRLVPTCPISAVINQACDHCVVRRYALGTLLFSIFLVRASEPANTTRICNVGFNTRPVPSLKIYAQMSSWMKLGRLSTVGADA